MGRRNNGPSEKWDFTMDSHTTGSRPGGDTLSTELLTDYHNNSIINFSVRWCLWEVMGRFPDQFWPKTLKSVYGYVLQCDVPHQWIARQVVSVSCDGAGCHVLCLRHGIPVKQRICQTITATSRHCHDLKCDVKSNKQTNLLIYWS